MNCPVCGTELREFVVGIRYLMGPSSVLVVSVDGDGVRDVHGNEAVIAVPVNETVFLYCPRCLWQSDVEGG